jgi:hypothetical protein
LKNSGTLEKAAAMASAPRRFHGWAPWTIPLFIPAYNRKEAEQEAPYWADCFVRVRGGFFVFDSEESLQKWKATPAADWPRV